MCVCCATDHIIDWVSAFIADRKFVVEIERFTDEHAAAFEGLDPTGGEFSLECVIGLCVVGLGMVWLIHNVTGCMCDVLQTHRVVQQVPCISRDQAGRVLVFQESHTFRVLQAVSRGAAAACGGWWGVSSVTCATHLSGCGVW